MTSPTDEGLRRLESAYPALPLSARRRVVDHVHCDAAAMTANQIRRIASVLGARRAPARPGRAA
ncbi:hypothetical protein ACH5AL_24650 [Actinacidiphila glaucinigra]|uniref:hypothetical protein n=1 Tax=Actinacidiphila glaucinigra TaxID=235986 RepID=UPI00379A651F